LFAGDKKDQGKETRERESSGFRQSPLFRRLFRRRRRLFRRLGLFRRRRRRNHGLLLLHELQLLLQLLLLLRLRLFLLLRRLFLLQRRGGGGGGDRSQRRRRSGGSGDGNSSGDDLFALRLRRSRSRRRLRSSSSSSSRSRGGERQTHALRPPEPRPAGVAEAGAVCGALAPLRGLCRFFWGGRGGGEVEVKKERDEENRAEPVTALSAFSCAIRPYHSQGALRKFSCSSLLALAKQAKRRPRKKEEQERGK